MSLKAEQAKAINNLYHRANELSAQVVLHGSADCRSAAFEELMNALYDIDGGEYDPEFNPIDQPLKP